MDSADIHEGKGQVQREGGPVQRHDEGRL